MRKIVRKEVLHSDLTAIADDRGRRITYEGLAKQAEELSACIEERSLIFLLCDHQMENAELLYEVLYLNRVPLLLASDIDSELLDHLIEVYRPQYLYCSRDHALAERYTCEKEFESHLLLKTGEKRYAIHPDVALLLSTSGTTGSPKLVKLSYGNLYSNAELICAQIDLQSGQRGLSPLSMNYVYGLNFCLWHWHCGATLLTTEASILSRQFGQFYEREQANNFAATPHIYQMLQRIKFWNPEKLNYLHRALCAGSQLSRTDQGKLISLMKEKFWIQYGQTESTGIVSGMNFNTGNMKLGTVGKLLEPIEASIDPVTKELILTNPQIVSMGYASHMEQLAEGDKNNGMLHTGDAAYIDEEGCIYLNGRLTRYVKILGKRVSLDDIEQYLNEKFCDIEFACTGTDDAIVIFYVGMERNLDKEIGQLLERSMKLPKKFISCFTAERIPHSHAGKVAYKELENWKNA